MKNKTLIIWLTSLTAALAIVIAGILWHTVFKPRPIVENRANVVACTIQIYQGNGDFITLENFDEQEISRVLNISYIRWNPFVEIPDNLNGCEIQIWLQLGSDGMRYLWLGDDNYCTLGGTEKLFERYEVLYAENLKLWLLDILEEPIAEARAALDSQI